MCIANLTFPKVPSPRVLSRFDNMYKYLKCNGLLSFIFEIRICFIMIVLMNYFHHLILKFNGNYYLIDLIRDHRIF